ncbi:GYP5 [Candida pseudojiufengensis]|uniref:GYP5 n=1 Tax=Candida pseudojiufengensis TaxID=497109 RepID=UPI00222512B9|nr:GYP5 [Candida pseudojiufengensis]KAI5960048.1 GYP5 [Candida pseudojiufengensis]
MATEEEVEVTKVSIVPEDIDQTTTTPILPSREPIQSILHLDSPIKSESTNSNSNLNDNSPNISSIQSSYDKSTSNYLLQSKHNILSIKFNNKESTIQKSIENGYENIKNTFNHIKNTVGTYQTDYNIDWDFWTQVVDNYDYIVNNKSEQLNNLINLGIPKEIRGIIWQIVTKSKDSNLEDFYRLLKQETSIHEKAIKRDLTRTSFFTNLESVDKANELFNVIKAYSIYDPDVGYTQGMIFIAVPLIMNMDESECFCLLVMLMKEYQLRDLFCPEMKGLHLLLYEFDCLLANYSPILYNHLTKSGIKSSMYASQWFLTFFAYKFPLNMVLRIYDIIITQGMESILKFAVNLMIQNENILLNLNFDRLLEYLKDKLFNVYVSPKYIRDKDTTKTSANSSSTGGKLNLLRKSSSNIPTINDMDYYKLDEFVTDSMKINIDPTELAKFESKFNQCCENEELKLKDIEKYQEENGKLRKQLKQLEFKFMNLNHNHIDIVQAMIDLKVSLPEINNENDELNQEIQQLKTDIENLELKTIDENSTANLPSSIENEIEELLKVNADEVNKTANLEDEIEKLLQEDAILSQQLKDFQKNNTWFRWS